jgi:hypothetical protein
MKGKHTQLGLDWMPLPTCLSARHASRDRDVSEVIWLDSWRLNPAWERQDVGQGILSTIATIQGAQTRIRHERHGNRPGHPWHGTAQPRTKPFGSQSTAMNHIDGKLS